MQESTSKTFECHGSTDIEQRAVRALTEYQTVLHLGGDIYSVTTESGSEYRVDSREGRCTCPDQQYNLSDDEQCKHQHRVAFATGDRPIPMWADTDAIDPRLGGHVDGGPRQLASDGGLSTANCGGQADEDGDEAHLEDTDTVDGRPDDCECAEFHGSIDLPCFPCYKAGFDTPASADEDDDGPTRHEKADFGHGESTGVQDL